MLGWRLGCVSTCVPFFLIRAPAKGSALKPGSKGALPPLLKPTCRCVLSMCAVFCLLYLGPVFGP